MQHCHIDTKTEISFDRLPMWQGVSEKPGNQSFTAVRLQINEQGFIRQQLSPAKESTLVESYKDPAYTIPTQPPGLSPWANRRGEWHVSFIKEHVSPMKGKSIVEIGAGSLFLAHRFIEEEGASRYLVIDPSIKEVTDDQRIRVIADYFDDRLHLNEEHPDLIFANICLQHVADPLGFLVKANRLLRTNDSKFVLIIPDIEEQFRRGDFNALFFENLNYFSEASATRLIAQAGFRVVVLEKKLDTLYFVLQKAVEAPSRDEEWADNELLGLAALKFEESLHKFKTVVTEAQKQGKTIACHGMCNGLNILFSLSGVPSDQTLLFDGDKSKVGKYLPSCPVPILSATSSRYRDADIVIVGAMTFFEEIRTFLTSFHGIPSKNILPSCIL